ncbi:50S ribosomal protein L23 [Candidatus Berkelbacteria bacterium]|nr:50S ribosomal protein L23 [Candidatus Berkelbacteria bacterium]MBI2588142.1 50S ribosomal protein L23 [Candidatus Berkelbacteria bacterium]
MKTPNFKVLISEKQTKAEDLSQYFFWVDKKAAKKEIKDLIEKIYKVKVRKVTTQRLKKKIQVKKKGRLLSSRLTIWKKAMVSLAPGQKIIALQVEKPEEKKEKKDKPISRKEIRPIGDLNE